MSVHPVHAVVVMRITFIILFALLVWVCPVQAQEDPSSLPPGQFFGTLKRTGTGRVDQVLDGLTILLKDKKIVRLSSLDIPDHAYPDGGVVNLASKVMLEKLLPSGTEILLYQTRKADTGRTNRMGQQIAHVVRKEGELWINGGLAESGLARAMPTDANPDLAAELYALEAKARDKNAGLWAPDGWPVLTPDTAESGVGEYRIAEGTVLSTATVKNNLYLNFGKDWKKDFTVMITPALRKELARRGVDPLSLSGRKVRVRGFIRAYNGPFVELENALRLETL